MKLRDYQQNIFEQLINSETNDLVQLDTGAGKTPIIAKLAEHYKQVVIVCHRNILIQQASDKLAACGVTHRILAAKAQKKLCAQNNIEKYGNHYINPREHIVLVSIDTWNSQFKRESLHFDFSKKYVVLIDEAHHFAAENKWELLNNTIGGRCIGFTATPIRADGKPLIKKFDGFFDRIIQADGYQDCGTEKLIAEGYLAQYRAFISAIDGVPLAEYDEQVRKEIELATNGYTDDEKKDRTLRLGETVLTTYEKYGNGGQAILICPLINNAIEEYQKLKKYGYKADIINSELPAYEIQRTLKAFERKEINILIAVDMISEGFDVPDADLLIIARKIRSFGLYRQICGRVLRPRPGKVARIVDIVGYSIAKHGLPSDPVDWEQEITPRKYKRLVICEECGFVYKLGESCCPECGCKKIVETKGKAYLNTKLVTTEMIEKHRQELALSEKKRIEDERKAEQERIFNETYLEVDVFFDTTLLSKRAREFFELFSNELKRQVKPREYNEFMKLYRFRLSELDFYIPHFLDFAQSGNKKLIPYATNALYNEKRV